MFFNFSHNSAEEEEEEEEEEEDPPMKIFTPYRKNSFDSLTRKTWKIKNFSYLDIWGK